MGWINHASIVFTLLPTRICATEHPSLSQKFIKELPIQRGYVGLTVDFSKQVANRMVIKITPCGSLNYRDSLKYFKAIATLQQAGWFVLPEFEFDGSRYITDQAKRKTQRKRKA